MSKEFFYPLKSNFYFYLISPILIFLLILRLWLIYPFITNSSNINFNFIFFLCILSIGVYGLIISGWSSNNSFSIIGALRSIAQSISYEVTLSISILIILIIINNINLNYLTIYQKYLVLFIIFRPPASILFISILAEINRTPFDLTEGESELVSGFNVEYRNRKFVLIFLAEYARIIFIIFIFTIIFLRINIKLIFYLTILFLVFLIIWIRITLPRIRYDNLIYFCWFYILPTILILFIIYIIYIKYPLEIFFIN